MAKMRSMQHNSRANSQGRTHGTKHNDRNFDVDLADNIDKERSKDNVYWHLYQATDPGLSFEDAELKYYVDAFGPQLQEINDQYLKNRHPERCKDMATWKQARRNAPEETTFQIGKMEEHVDAKILMDCFQDYNARLEAWNDTHGRPFTQLTYALHVDEAVPHIQARRVWHYEDAKGQLRVGQEKALAAAGVELPKPEAPEGKKNNRKMTFDAMAREMWLDVLHEHGLEIERDPLPDGKHNREKEDMIRDKYREMVAETERLEGRVKELETQLQERNHSFHRAVGAEIQARMEDLPERIERKAVPLSKDKVAVSAQELDALELRAKLSIINDEAHRTAQKKIDKKLAEAAQDAAAAFSLRQHYGREAAAASATKERYEKLCEEQGQLNRTVATLRDTIVGLKVDNLALKCENQSLKEENQSMKSQLAAVPEQIEKATLEAVQKATRPLQEKIESLKGLLKSAYEGLTAVIRAIKMLKYDKEQGYGVQDLTPKQGNLIDGLVEYGVKWAKYDGFPELAKQMEDGHGLSKGIKKILEPPELEVRSIAAQKPKKKQWEHG